MAKFKNRSCWEARPRDLRCETYARLARGKSARDKPFERLFFEDRERLSGGQERVMQNGLYVAVSAQVALERRLETIADNIANMNTVGYRATGVSFEAEIAKAGETTLNYVSPGSDYLSRRIGGLVKTDNPLDFAVQGDGWFGIQTPSGPPIHETAGRASMSPERCARSQATRSSTLAAPRSLSTARLAL